MKIKPPRKTPNSARFLNAYGPYEHGIWSKQQNSLDSTSEFAGTMLFYRRSYELVEQISKSLLEIFTKNELKNKSILDIGCYDGWILHMLNQKFNFKIALGIEPRQKNIDKGIYARNFYSIKSDVKFKLGTINSANKIIGNKKFDIVINLGTLHHVSSTPDAIKSLCEISNDILIIDSMVIPEPTKDKTKILKYLNLKDLVYFNEKKIWAIAGYKFESPYFDGSTSDTQIVNVPEERLIQMSLEIQDFKIIRQTAPEKNFYNKKMQKLRGVKESLIISRKNLVNQKELDWQIKIHDHELFSVATKIDPIIIYFWLRKLNLVKDAKFLKSLINNLHFISLFKGRVAFNFSVNPTKIILKLSTKFIKKSATELELISNISRAPLDKILLELGKFYISKGHIFEAIECLERIVDKFGSDWRSFYRACFLLSYAYETQNRLKESHEYLNLLNISNPNWPFISTESLMKELSK